MNRQSQLFIRTALVYLVAAFAVGATVLINQALELNAQIPVLLPVFYHLLMVGWVTQLICGVALWMFPVVSRARPRGKEWLGWLCYAALNTGLLLRAVGEPAHALIPGDWWAGRALVVSAVVQVVGIWAFVLAIWPRVKGRTARQQRP